MIKTEKELKEKVGECLDCSKSDAEDKEKELEAIVNAPEDGEELVLFTLPVSCEEQ